MMRLPSKMRSVLEVGSQKLYAPGYHWTEVRNESLRYDQCAILSGQTSSPRRRRAWKPESNWERKRWSSWEGEAIRSLWTTRRSSVVNARFRCVGRPNRRLQLARVRDTSGDLRAERMLGKYPSRLLQMPER